MLHIAPHPRAKAKEPPTSCEIGCWRVAWERERVRESSWWMFQILVKSVKKLMMIKKWKFVYVSVEQLVIVSVWSDPPVFIFFLFIFTYWNWWFPRILRLQSDWFIGEHLDAGTNRWSQLASPRRVPRCRHQALRCIKQPRDAHFERRQSAIEISAATK